MSFQSISVNEVVEFSEIKLARRGKQIMQRRVFSKYSFKPLENVRSAASSKDLMISQNSPEQDHNPSFLQLTREDSGK